MSEAQKLAWENEDIRRARTAPAVGFFVDKYGYIRLTGMAGDPLANGGNVVLEHRKILYDAIGPGPHMCYWGCGKVLEWKGQNGLHADHINGDKTDNRRENLVPSCNPCNKARAQVGNPSDWRAL
jgi:hypothetical protein